MDTIKELHYGNINPCDRDVEPDNETDQLAKLVLRLDTQLKESLNENEAETFGKLKDAWTELSCLNECTCFVNGFKLGARLAAESLLSKKQVVFNSVSTCVALCAVFIGK